MSEDLLPESAQGNVAHDTADAGNPVKIGGKGVASTPSEVTEGDRVDAWFNRRGTLTVNIRDNSGNDPTFVNWASNDGMVSAFHTSIAVAAQGYLYNGSGTDAARGNVNATVLASSARTGTNQSADQTNYNGRGLHLVINVTAVTSSPSVVFTIQGKDAVSGSYYTILASAAVVGTGTTVLRVFPSATAAANTVANDILPRTWRVNAAHANGDSITYSVGASIIL
jgi:hypothetical protein